MTSIGSSLIVASFLAAIAAYAGDRAAIAGLIKDATGAVLVSATVTAMDEETGIRRSGNTDEAGSYSIRGLPLGHYRLIVRRPGFQTIVRWNVKIDPGLDARLDFVMQVGSMKEVVTIEGAAPPVNKDDASVSTLLPRKAVETLPTSGRGIISLVELSPGVVATPATDGEAGQFSANGLRANTNYFTVDGVSANTGVIGGGLPAQLAGNALPAMTAFGSTHSLASTEALDEVRIFTSSFAPQFGRKPGAQVALTTRSGSNDFHGTAFYSLRNEALDANDWFANANAYGRAPLRLNQWGATVGGPLRRDRTFFFASYEALRLRQSNTWTTVTPGLEARSSAPPEFQPVLRAFPLPSGPALGGGLVQRIARFTNPSRLDTASVRIDHALSERIGIFGRYNWAPSYTESGFAQIEHFRLRTSSFTLGVSSMLSALASNDLRTNIWSTTAAAEWSFNSATGGTPLDFSRILPAPTGSAPAFYGIAIGGTGALYSGENGRNHQLQWNLVDTLAMRRGAHDLRLGVDYARLNPAREGAADSVTGAWNSLTNVLAGNPPLIMSTHAEQASAIIETLSVFAQDTWALSPRLTLTYGLRWELTPPPALREPAAAASTGSTVNLSFAGSTNLSFLPVASLTQSLWRTRYTQFAPRIGAAFRLDRASVLRAGWGLFYDAGFSATLDPINGFPFNRWQFSSSGAPFAATAATLGRRVAPDLTLPYVLEWNVAYERLFGTRNTVSLTYAGSSGRRLLRYEGVLQPGSRLAQFIVATNHGQSTYHSLELQYRRRLARGFQATASYAWSHSIDNGSWDSGVYLADPRLSPLSDRASSSFDVRHNFTAGLSYTLPPASPVVMGRITQNWELSAMIRARTGFPIDILTTENLLGLGFDNVTRPDVVPGTPVWVHDNGTRRLNPDAFAAPSGLQGSLGRNAITGFGMHQLDLALQRSFPIAERANIELRAEAYNAFNHPNAADPVRFLDSPFFGTSLSMLNLMLGRGSARSGLVPAFQIGGPRSLQVALRFRF